MVHHLELVNRNEKGILKSTFKYKSLFFPNDKECFGVQFSSYLLRTETN